jgi:aldehyde dehydrogenase (NAD+)
MTPSDRGKPLAKLADMIEARKDELAVLDARSIGRPVSIYFDAHYAVMQLRYFSQAAYAMGTTSLNTPGFMNFSLRQPYGVCAAIIPWNAPLVFLSKKLAPALAAGNTVILKTSEKAPLTSDLVARMLNEAGFPPGVVNVIHGHGAVSGQAISSHMSIRALSFTGSVATGRRIMRASADSNFKHVIFELGGKSPAIVFADADLEAAAAETQNSIMFHSGQTCMANSRIYVQKSVADRFVQLFTESAARRKLGDPEDPTTNSGPQADSTQHLTVTKYVQEGTSSGLESYAATEALPKGEQEKGNFVAPTIFRHLPEDSKLMKDEIFGPVVCINTFEDESDALAWANDSEYGLYAAVYTRDLDRAMRVARGLESGMVGVNCTSPTGCWDLPFGGYKQSGIGREGFMDSLSDWLETKSVYVKVNGLSAVSGPANGVLGR